MPDPIETIANLIVEEASNIPDNDLMRAVYHVKRLVELKVGDMMEIIRNAELAERLRKEIIGKET